MAVGHLEFLAIYDYETYEIHKVIPAEIPLGRDVFGSVTFHNDTEFARTMTCKVGFVRPDLYPEGVKEYENVWVPAGGHKTATTDRITLNKAGTWKILATLDGLAVAETWDVINVSGWELLKTIDVTLNPVLIGGWHLLKTIDVTLTPPGVPPPPPPPECAIDADCPEGYVCKDGKCVKKEAGFPWQWLAIGGAAITGVILLIPKPKKAVKK